MVAGDLSIDDVRNPERELSFPDSVVAFMRGELGYPADGFPADIQQRILKGAPPIEGRAAAHLPPADLEAERARAAKAVDARVSDTDLASWLMYPKVFTDYMTHRRRYGDVSGLPTPAFFYGLSERDEIAVDIDKGKTLVIRLLSQAEEKDSGEMRVFFELNGQPRPVRIPIAGQAASARKSRPKAEDGNPQQVGAPMPGAVASVTVKPGQRVARGAPLLSIEAMKMENAVAAEHDGVVARVLVAVGDQVEAKDLLIEFREPEAAADNATAPKAAQPG